MFKIKKELAQKVLEYLAKRPYIEVAGLVNELQRLEMITEKKEEKKKETK